MKTLSWLPCPGDDGISPSSRLESWVHASSAHKCRTHCCSASTPRLELCAPAVAAHPRTCMRDAASCCCSFSALRHWLSTTLFLMPRARLPKRSEESVSAALSPQGEQHTISTVRAVPPCGVSAWWCVGLSRAVMGRGEGSGARGRAGGNWQALNRHLALPMRHPRCPTKSAKQMPRSIAAPADQRVLQHTRQLAVPVGHVLGGAAAGLVLAPTALLAAACVAVCECIDHIGQRTE